MNVLGTDRNVAILTGLTEGCSIRSVSRMTGSHIETILKLLVETGAKAQAMLDEKMRRHYKLSFCTLLLMLR